MQSILLLIHVLVCVFIVVMVLLQHGKGADVGAAFGSGASNTMFGSEGSLPFLVKLTCILAFIFYVTSISLGHLASVQSKRQQGVSNTAVTMPAIPASPEGDAS
ncbi:MAG: preprotein translocase subunit SecG [Legionellales bacterium]|nr:preprotein translocase subunit SecG [Legionellales bacterium]HAG61435.1 preprotein translocase subunit SecG [Coxiellaceae bacterium]